MSRADLSLASGESLWRPRLRTRKAVGAAFVGLCVLSVVVGVAMLAALVIDVSARRGRRACSPRRNCRSRRATPAPRWA